MPTSRFGSVDFGILPKMCASSPGASFDAHPALLTVAVSRIFSCVIISLYSDSFQLSGEMVIGLRLSVISEDVPLQQSP